MDVFEAIKTRRSIRKFKDAAVEKEKLIKVLEAARLAPSAANLQPWSFIVVSNKTIRQSLFSAYSRQWFVDAPIIIVVVVLLIKAGLEKMEKNIIQLMWQLLCKT